MATYPIKPPVCALNMGHPLSKNLVFDAPMFERGGTTIHDVSQKKLAFPFVNLTASAWTKNQYGATLSFPGTNEYVNPGSTTSLNNIGRNMSIAAIIRTNTVAAGGRGIFTMGSGGWYFRLNAGKVNFLRSNTTDIITGATTLATDKTYHVGVTVSLGATATFKIYVNGVIDATLTSATTPAFGKFVTIGSDVDGASNPNEFFNGEIGSVRFWTRELMPIEMQQLYVNPWQIYQHQDGLVN